MKRVKCWLVLLRGSGFWPGASWMSGCRHRLRHSSYSTTVLEGVVHRNSRRRGFHLWFRDRQANVSEGYTRRMSRVSRARHTDDQMPPTRTLNTCKFVSFLGFVLCSDAMGSPLGRIPSSGGGTHPLPTDSRQLLIILPSLNSSTVVGVGNLAGTEKTSLLFHYSIYRHGSNAL